MLYTQIQKKNSIYYQSKVILSPSFRNIDWKRPKLDCFCNTATILQFKFLLPPSFFLKKGSYNHIHKALPEFCTKYSIHCSVPDTSFLTFPSTKLIFSYSQIMLVAQGHSVTDSCTHIFLPLCHFWLISSQVIAEIPFLLSTWSSTFILLYLIPFALLHF